MFLSQCPEILILAFFLKCIQLPGKKGFVGGSVVKNPTANAGDVKDVGLIPGLGRSPEEGMTTHSSILA